MVFVTVGSQHFQFNRLIASVDECVRNGSINEEVFAQIGHSTYSPQNFSYVKSLSRMTFSEKLNHCSMVITHGGSGAIIGALKSGKKVLAMPRLSKFGEHVDDHQLQIVEEFVSAGLIVSCKDSTTMAEGYNALLAMETISFKSNNASFLSDLDSYLQSSCKG